jgi:hypothetical protein
MNISYCYVLGRFIDFAEGYLCTYCFEVCYSAVTKSAEGSPSTSGEFNVSTEGGSKTLPFSYLTGPTNPSSTSIVPSLTFLAPILDLLGFLLDLWAPSF